MKPHFLTSPLLRKVSAVSDMASIMPGLLNPLEAAHNVTVAVDKCPDYQVNFVQVMHCWDWGTCMLYGIQGFSNFMVFYYTQMYINACICD